MHDHRNNPLMQTDVYKLGHLEQYPDGTDSVYSHLLARSDKKFNDVLFFGLQYILKRYLTQPLKVWMADELLRTRQAILGSTSQKVVDRIHNLCDLGYWPVQIKAVPEGSILPTKHVLTTIRNTHPDFAWCAGFIESLLLKVWYPTTVATQCWQYRKLVRDFWAETVGVGGLPEEFAVHDFGYRGDSSEEGAALSGVAHLTCFTGSDTVPAYKCAVDYYRAKSTDAPIMLSVPASEHSVMCAFGRDNELAAFQHMLDTYPKGIVSIVSDQYDVWHVLTKMAQDLKPQIMARDGKVVFRPDSGDPEKIITGDPDSKSFSPASYGALKLLHHAFGGVKNNKGFTKIDNHVGLIYGDGMYLERYRRTLETMRRNEYAADNLVIGVGGILRNHSRDTLGFAIKATHVTVNGEPREIEKDPITDPGKKSLKGLLRLEREAGQWITIDRVSEEAERGGLLVPVFRDGIILKEYSLEEIRRLVKLQLALTP
jgi:nicotinamide phosphoribosyltransferase